MRKIITLLFVVAMFTSAVAFAQEAPLGKLVLNKPPAPEQIGAGQGYFIGVNFSQEFINMLKLGDYGKLGIGGGAEAGYNYGKMGGKFVFTYNRMKSLATASTYYYVNHFSFDMYFMYHFVQPVQHPIDFYAMAGFGASMFNSKFGSVNLFNVGPGLEWFVLERKLAITLQVPIKIYYLNNWQYFTTSKFGVSLSTMLGLAYHF